jgi:sugar/nucleoside kinase (ribokinase family)
MKNITPIILELLGTHVKHEPAVTIIGDLNYDYIYSCPALERGKEVFITSFSREIAGAGGYVACGLARLGASVEIVTELGDDAEGRALYEELGRRGIHRGGIRLLPGKRSPFTLIFAEEAEGNPRQVATLQGSLADFTLRPDDFESFVSRSRLVYSCSYFVMPALRAAIGDVFRRARGSGILTAYDANGGDGWDDAAALRVLKEDIYPAADFIFLNAAEARCVTGLHDPAKAAQAVRPEGATVIVKHGAQGLFLRTRGRLVSIDAFPLSARLKDTVGAGDSFQAAFLYFALCGLAPEYCAIIGAANAASTVLHTGGTEGQLDRSGLADYISGYQVLDSGDDRIVVQG